MKRRKVFEYIVRDIAKCSRAKILPKWAMGLHWLLFPIISLRYWNDERNGYDVVSDIWNINGIKVTGSYFYRIAQPGKKFEVVEIDDTGIITLRDLEE